MSELEQIEKDIDELNVPESDLAVEEENEGRKSINWSEAASNPNLNLLISKMQIVLGDLKLSEELVNNGICDNDVKTVKNERIDTENYIETFNSVSSHIVEYCQNKK